MSPSLPLPLDLLVAGGMMLPRTPGEAPQERGAVGIREGRIAWLGPAEEAPSAVERLDATGCAILPGLVNTHTHSPMVCFRGLADDLPLERWLEDHIWPAERAHADEDMVRAGATLAMAEMLRSGTTTFCDAYFHGDTIAAAVREVGLRAVVCQGFMDLGPEPAEAALLEARAEGFVADWQGCSPLLTPALFCHSPYTCSARTLQTVKAAARRLGVGFQTHLSETEGEVLRLRARCGCTPAEYLDALDLLDTRTLAVHCTWMTDAELDLLAERGVKVSHNPESNLKLAAGVAPLPAMLRRGISVGLGTDGCASNNDLDLFGEMQTAAKLHKFVARDPTVLDARTVFRMATLGGAEVLGLERETGSLELGKWADLILVDLEQPHLTPLYDLASNLVYAARGTDVRTVLVAGRLLMKDRRLLTLDLPGAMAEVRRIARRIRPAGSRSGAPA